MYVLMRDSLLQLDRIYKRILYTNELVVVTKL
jgi:hypothetical protein